MIDHDLKAIYLHIGKTAGSSIENMMNDRNRSALITDRHQMYGYDKEEGIYLQHASAETIRRLAGDEIFQNYLKFTIVRNPYSRMLSVYHYLIDQHKRQFGSFRGYIESLPELVNGQILKKGSHHISQTYYTHIGDDVVCDYIGKFEELPLSIEPIRIQLKIENYLRKHNIRRSVNWSRRSVASYYTPSMQHIMQDVFADDFLCFDYSCDPEDIPFSFWETKIKAARQTIKPYIPARVRAFIRQF